MQMHTLAKGKSHARQKSATKLFICLYVISTRKHFGWDFFSNKQTLEIYKSFLFQRRAFFEFQKAIIENFRRAFFNENAWISSNFLTHWQKPNDIKDFTMILFSTDSMANGRVERTSQINMTISNHKLSTDTSSLLLTWKMYIEKAWLPLYSKTSAEYTFSHEMLVPVV